MKNASLVLSICVLTISACNRSDEVVEMEYRYYKEGPHVVVVEGSANAISFVKDDRIWTMEVALLLPVDSAVISVENPVSPPFQVRLHTSNRLEASEYAPADKITVVADIEGNFAGFYSLLLMQNVIDKDCNWIYGNGHLVMLGDLFDRGPDVTPIFWLLYKLETEARKAGGYVHTILGNHEIMNFNGDLRYLHKKYKVQAKHTGFEYPELYNMTTVLGRWLRSKPAVIRIGDNLFSHAGVSPELLALNLTLSEINALVKEQNMNPAPLVSQSQTETIFGTNGIFWYRGWVDNPESAGVLDNVLEKYNSRHMIIGHTIVRDMQASFDFKLLAIDLHQPKKLNRKPVRALCIENDTFFEIDNRGIHIPIISK